MFRGAAMETPSRQLHDPGLFRWGQGLQLVKSRPQDGRRQSRRRRQGVIGAPGMKAMGTQIIGKFRLRAIWCCANPKLRSELAMLVSERMVLSAHNIATPPIEPFLDGDA